MAFISADIYCPSVERTLAVQLYFPTDLPAAVGNKVSGVVTLLHGLGNAPANWMMYSAAPRYAADNGYILVVPQADNSFYTDPAFGTPFYTALTLELPAQLRRIFHIPEEREKNFVAGLSMGGYGAMRLALSLPERYAAVGSFSGALDMGAMLQAGRALPAFAPLLSPLFGQGMELPKEADLFALVRGVAALPAAQQPKIFQTCGLQDDDAMHILTQNHSFAALAKTLPLAAYRYLVWDGVHEWNFWDRSFAEFMSFVQGSDYAARKKQDWAAETLIQEDTTP